MYNVLCTMQVRLVPLGTDQTEGVKLVGVPQRLHTDSEVHHSFSYN